MKPASTAVISNISQRLLEDIQVQNGAELQNATTVDSTWLRAIEQSLTAVRMSMLKRLSKDREDWNDKLLISRLPVETLTGIFLECLPTDALYKPLTGPETRRFDALLRLALVCQRWNDLVMGTPALWTHISGRETIDRVRLALTRSKTHPIEVTCAKFGAISNVEKEGLAAFAKIITPHVKRIRSLVINVPFEALREFCPAVQSSAPLLERLNLTIHAPGGQQLPYVPPIDFLAGDKPLLKSVSVHSVPCLWTTASFRAFEIIRLGDLQGGAPTLSHIFNMLELSKMTLKDLLITQVDVQDDPSLQNVPQIDLPVIEHFQLSLSPSVTERLFTHIRRMPACTNVHLQTSIDNLTQAGILKSCTGHLIPELHRILHAPQPPKIPGICNYLHIICSDSGVRCTNWPRGLSLEVWFAHYTDQPLRDVVDMLTQTDFHRPIRISVEGDLLQFVNAAFWEILLPLDSIKHLGVCHLMANAPGQEIVMQSLSDFLARPPADALPALRLLDLESVDLPITCLATMLERRFPNPEDALNTMWMWLRCWNMDKKVARRIRRMLGNQLKIHLMNSADPDKVISDYGESDLEGVSAPVQSQHPGVGGRQ